MQRTPRSLFVFLVAATALVVAGSADAATNPAVDSAVQRLSRDSGGTAAVSFDGATGVVRFVRLDSARLPLAGANHHDRARAFFESYGAAFGVRSFDAELRRTGETTDRLGMTHVTYDQVYRGLPVFAGRIKLHFRSDGSLATVNGTFIPGIRLGTDSLLTSDRAVEIALRDVAKSFPGAELAVASNDLMIFRAGLVQGVSGDNYLARQVEVTNGRDVRERIYVDVATGAILERITRVYREDEEHPMLTRRVYQPDFAPEFLLWEEGDAFPTGDFDVDNLVSFVEETFFVFANLTNEEFLSYDGLGSPMETAILADDDGGCPNAFAGGGLAWFCRGVTGDDTVGHEWTHNYTDFTHDLIYMWQSGALNESYSDIFGEVMDEIGGPNFPNSLRAADKCSVYVPTTDRELAIDMPISVAGQYAALEGAFGGTIDPVEPLAGVFDLVDDGDDEGGAGSVSDGCQFPFVNDVSGKIALIDRGSCEFGLKSLNAEMSGAIGVVIINNAGDDLILMGGGAVGDQVTIPPVMIGQSDGELIKSALPEVITGEITLPPDVLDRFSDDSYRWLVGEDDPGFGGAIRDMWNPTCMSNPGKVTDPEYWCDDGDGGGVHTNSGVPNHAFALLVDGGEYNGRTVRGIGWNKAAAIYWRAMSVYQVQTTDFADHVDALVQSCSDLLGAEIYDLSSGAPLPETIEIGDCAQMAAATQAVELRAENNCGFEPLLAKNPPPFCDSGSVSPVFLETFEAAPVAWTPSNEGVNPEYVPRDWQWVDNLPAGRPGQGMFGLDSIEIGDCIVGSDDQSGVMFLDSPAITVPEGGVELRVFFEHYVATEYLWDGGNVSIRVNGGAWVLMGPERYTFNPYNAELDTILTFPPNGNPLAGEWAFTGADGGSLEGSWGRSVLTLPGQLFQTGDTLELRFSFGVDGCNGLDGWYLDLVGVHSCESPGAMTSSAAAPAIVELRRLPR